MVCRPDGRVNPEAVGWSRRPLHRFNLRGRWGRKKRWDYWCVTSDELLFSITVADLDYLGVVTVLGLDLNSGRQTVRFVPVPGAVGFRLADSVGGSDIHFRMPGFRVDVVDSGAAVGLRARIGRSIEADIAITRPAAHETLNVLVPWDERRFQFTSKQNTLPATGTVRLGKRAFSLGPENQSFACLDFGRGVWPYRTEWNWASASGVQSGRAVGLQLGGKWTDGTGVTENGVCVDGRLSKIGERLVFEYDRSDFARPWRIRTESTDRIDLTFSPAHPIRQRWNLVVAAAEVHLMVGHFSGTVTLDGGERLSIDGLLGWAEEMRARW